MDKEANEPNLWNDKDKAQKILTQKAEIDGKIKFLRNIDTEFEDLIELHNIAISENDEQSKVEIENSLETFFKKLSKEKLDLMLNGEADSNSAYLEIHSGAGGTEACDWAEMLLRMYLRWAEKHNFKVSLIEEHSGDEAGIKSATLEIDGRNVYGWLKGESGIHRLVRISPFDSGARRHTSFASVWVYPVVDDKINIEINEKDLKIDTYRASGAGGQHVNKTDSAIRITHIPTNTVVQCQDERSQFKNKDRAMKMLRSKLYEAQRQKIDSERAGLRKSQVGTGDRSDKIRTYNYPQNRVTDHRVNLTLYKLDYVMIGEALDEIIDKLITEDQIQKLSEL